MRYSTIEGRIRQSTDNPIQKGQFDEHGNPEYVENVTEPEVDRMNQIMGEIFKPPSDEEAQRMADAMLISEVQGLLPLMGHLRQATLNPHPMAGLCFVATSALYHLGLGKRGFIPHRIVHCGVSHWYLKGHCIVDLTEDQFSTPVPHSEGKNAIGYIKTFDGPTKRPKELMEKYFSIHKNTPHGGKKI